MDLICKITPFACVETTVSSLATSGAREAKRFAILSADKAVPANDLQFLEFSGIVSKALITQGFIPEGDAQKVEVVIVLSYSRSAPQQKSRVVTDTEFGFTGGGTSTTTGLVAGKSFTATTTTPSTYGPVGTTSSVVQETAYTRQIKLDAYDVKKLLDGKLVQTWRVDLTSIGTIADLRTVFPAMVAAGAPSFGVKTTKAISIQKRISGADVKALVE